MAAIRASQATLWAIERAQPTQHDLFKIRGVAAAQRLYEALIGGKIDEANAGLQNALGVGPRFVRIERFVSVVDLRGRWNECCPAACVRNAKDLGTRLPGAVIGELIMVFSSKVDLTGLFPGLRIRGHRGARMAIGRAEHGSRKALLHRRRHSPAQTGAAPSIAHAIRAEV